MTVYTFEGQVKKGEKGENILDIFYIKRYRILQVSMELQKLGIDRIWIDEKIGFRHFVEYKTDFTAANTNKIFIETISVDKENKLGWAITSCARFLVIYVPTKISYVAHMEAIHFYLRDWQNLYEKKVIENKSYFTIGICVPINIFERICCEINKLE